MKAPTILLALALGTFGCHGATEDPDAATSALDEELVCGAHSAELIAGQHHRAGVVTLHHADGVLEVETQSQTGAGWYLRRVHVYVGTGPPSGVADPWAPGTFPYQAHFDEPTSSHIFSIPLDEVGAACGDGLTVAVHADVAQLDADGAVVALETAWASGEPFDSARWGWSIDFATCCDDEPVEDPGPTPDPTTPEEPDQEPDEPDHDADAPDEGHDGPCP